MNIVAIWMVTYNHEDYITQAVESVMIQKTDFKYKLFLGEDCSTDKTREICIELKEKYPNKIELVLQKKNTGGYKNAYDIYKLCFESEAKYIAMMDGDDYWTDSLKLQKQIDFLEKNPKFSLCFHNANFLNLKDGTQKPFCTSSKNIYTTRDIIKNKWFCQIGSVLYRNSVMKDRHFLNALKTERVLVNIDQLLLITVSLHGPLYYMNEIMHTYRYSVIGSLSDKNKSVYMRYKNILDYLNYLNEFTKGQFTGTIFIKRVYIYLGIIKNVMLRNIFNSRLL